MFLSGDFSQLPFRLFHPAVGAALPQDLGGLSEILLSLGGSRIPEAEQWIRKAVEADARNGMRFHLGLDHALYGEFFKQQGDRTKAQEQLGKAAEILRECCADGWVEKTERKLAEMA